MSDLFSLKGKVVVITGGAAALASSVALALGKAGAQIALTSPRRYEETAEALRGAGLQATGFAADAMKRESLAEAREDILKVYGRIDVLLNMAGGNKKEATTSAEANFFDLPLPAMEQVFALNLFAGAILPAQVFGKAMAANPEGGSIINVSSMAAFKPLTRIASYSAAKAAVSNFTQWLAVHLAKEYNPKLRVNALAPGFFFGEQNKFLLKDEKGNLTERGKAIIAHTPMGRFGEPSDLDGAALYLASDASKFVTGLVLPIDGGFSAFAGV